MSKKTKLIQPVMASDDPIEIKLLRFYIKVEFGWLLLNGIMDLVLGIPKVVALMFLALSVGIIPLYFLAYKSHKEAFFRDAYFIAVFVLTPPIWFMTGGFRTSSNILFVCELVLFVMCLKGKKQHIYVILSMLSTGITQNVFPRLPVPVYPMTDIQYAKEGSVLGLSTCVLIASLLIRQKAEYMMERDNAVTAKVELEKSNRLQKNFLANMSHEIRSPLGIVMGFNNLIKDSNDIDQIHEYSKDIKSAGSTLLAVINDILDYSKIESGKLDIIEDDYSFSELISGIKKDIGLKCDEKGLSFVTKIDEKIPETLHGDNIRIKQCLINLLSNAVKYTERGVVTLNVSCEEKTDDYCTIKYIIKDTGKGISETALPNLYTAFQRLDEGMNRGIEGTGLGLAITKNLLDEMHGTIDVESELGVGTAFTIVLDQKYGQKKVDAAPLANDISISGVNVLVVDDTQLNLTLIRKLLNKEGATVTALDNGKACLAEAAEQKYDIILLDHMMPEMNGVEVFKRLKEQEGVNKDTPIVMLTANAMAGAMKEYIDMGFDSYLSKPISNTQLRETIYRLVNR